MKESVLNNPNYVIIVETTAPQLLNCKMSCDTLVNKRAS